MSFAPLSDIRVLDLTRLLPGPYGTQLLADLGATVTKIEEPDTGDYLRELTTDQGTGPRGMSYFFEYLNAGKESVAIDLKTVAGRDVFYQLVEHADVVTESFRPGVVDRLGVDYETLSAINEDLVYCSLSGYGQTGPYSDRSGHDINYLAVSGILSLTGPKDGPPVVPGTLIADLAAGTFLAVSILGALVDGTGEYIDLSMTDVVTTWTIPYMHEYFATETAPSRGRTPHQLHPAYNVYATGDDEFLAIGCLEEHFWVNLCEALDLEAYIDDHLTSDEQRRAEIRAELEATFRERTRDEWIELLAGHDVPVAPVNELNEVPSDAQIAARDIVVGEALQRFRFPALFGGDVGIAGTHAPKLGEDTADFLQAVGLSAEKITDLASRDVIATNN